MTLTKIGNAIIFLGCITAVGGIGTVAFKLLPAPHPVLICSLGTTITTVGWGCRYYGVKAEAGEEV